MGARRVLVTGAEGVIGTAVREHLGGRYELTSLTLTPQEFPSHVADIADLDAIRPAFEGVDAVVHLAASPAIETPWEDVLHNNIVGTYNVFEAARLAGVERVVFASSNHAVGMYELDGAPGIYEADDERRVDHTAEIRPDSLYGVSKAYGEALGRMYVERHGLRVFCLRIGAVRAHDDPTQESANPLLDLDAEGRRNRHARRLAQPARLRRADRALPRGGGRGVGGRLRRLGEPAPVLGPGARAGAARLGAAGLRAGVSAAHRGGSGPPLVLLHGFTDTWRTWELVLPALERRHDVFAPTLPGHAGGPALEGAVHRRLLADAVERAMDEAGFETAHIAGNSLGGYVALQLAARGRADRSSRSRRPAAGRPATRRSGDARPLREDAGAACRRGAARRRDRRHRRRAGAGRPSTSPTNFEHIPAELVAHQMRGAAACDAPRRCRAALRDGLAARRRRIDCPVRSSGEPRTGCCRGRGRRALPRASGCRTPTGWCSTASATARSSTSRWRRRS